MFGDEHMSNFIIKKPREGDRDMIVVFCRSNTVQYRRLSINTQNIHLKGIPMINACRLARQAVIVAAVEDGAVPVRVLPWARGFVGRTVFLWVPVGPVYRI